MPAKRGLAVRMLLTSRRLGAAHKVVRRLIESDTPAATQVAPRAPWELPSGAIEGEGVMREVEKVRRRILVRRVVAEKELAMLARL